MTGGMKSEKLSIDALRKRERELQCLYQIQEILRDTEKSLDEVCPQIISAINSGWLYPEKCRARIIINDSTYESTDLAESPWLLTAPIAVQDKTVGNISIYYTEEMPAADIGPFLKEESRLLGTIAGLLGQYVVRLKTKELITGSNIVSFKLSDGLFEDWRTTLEILKQIDIDFYFRISRKMLNELNWGGVVEAKEMSHTINSRLWSTKRLHAVKPGKIEQERISQMAVDFGRKAFDLAGKHLSDEDILRHIMRWIQEDKLGFLAQVINRNLSIADVADAIRRYYDMGPHDHEIQSPSKSGIQISLIRRFLSEQSSYIDTAKNFLDIRDFYDLLGKVIFSVESRGKLGGKSSGMILAGNIIRRKNEEHNVLKNIKIPKTWYITSDVIYHFMHYNNFDEVVEQKYKSNSQIRLEYPYIEQLFRNGYFPEDILKGLSAALDDFDDSPIIVRSSSLLEDQIDSAFYGKYKSLILANQGSKEERLDALTDAIAEIYASTFSPDPIECRVKSGLLDYGEEMGIMIQEVVGTKIGDYFLPTFSGVAFSSNRFCWSHHIKPEDGLICMLPGLGDCTTARLKNRCPIFVSPGQPDSIAGLNPGEIMRSPDLYIDVINLKQNNRESINLNRFLKDYGHSIPGIENIFADSNVGNDAVTFEKLFSESTFLKKMHKMLRVLEDAYRKPIYIEFASDGKDLFLLQCRPQGLIFESGSVPIPKNISPENIMFTSNYSLTEGDITDITHIIYIDPFEYRTLKDKSDIEILKQTLGRLNRILPKRQFIIIGPQWRGTYDNSKSESGVAYSDVDNAAALIELTDKKEYNILNSGYGLSFIQDVFEASIYLIPICPKDDNTVLNKGFLGGLPNILTDVIPNYTVPGRIIKLIDIPGNAGGRKLRISMNSELQQVLGFLTASDSESAGKYPIKRLQVPKNEDYWRWRLKMAEYIASELDGERFGVVDFYVFGSTKNATAGPGSDINIIIHFRGDPSRLEKLNHWLEGWSRSLAKINYLRTGYESEGLLDVHIVTDEDISKKTSYAVKIGAVTDAARPLPLKNKK